MKKQTIIVGSGRYHAPGCCMIPGKSRELSRRTITRQQLRKWWLLDLLCHRCKHQLLGRQ